MNGERRERVGRIAGLSIVLALALGCRGGVSEEGGVKPASAPVTFTKEVAPIVFRECAPCHHPGGTAPFSILDYREAKQHAGAIADLTRRRLMPPWLPQHGYGEFAGERRLSDAEIQLLGHWTEQGAPEGQRADLPDTPHFTPGWRLGDPDLVLQLPKPYLLSADGTDRWRNFVLPVPASRPRYVKAVELHPGSAQFVHHALMGVDATRSSRRRDAEDTEPGFEGMDLRDAQAPDGHLLGWTPGMSPFPGVDGKAWRLDPGADLVLQLHLLPTGKPEAVQPNVGLYFASGPPSGPPMYLLRLDADHAIDIPPGQSRFVVSETFELPVDVEVFAVYPHAHLLATTMEAVAKLPDGQTRWLIRIDRWDFKWQDIYRYRSPVSLPKGTTITMTFSYDNSGENPRNPSRPPQRVVAGLRSSDEMAHLQLQLQAPSAGDLLSLREAFYRHGLQKAPRDGWLHYELANVLRDKGLVDKAIASYRAALEIDPKHAPARNNLGVLLADEGHAEEAISEYRQALRIEADFADAHFNLANAFRATGRLDDAARHYLEALRLEPAFVEAHNNLGATLGAQGRMREAISHFREALKLQPDHVNAGENLRKALEATGR